MASFGLGNFAQQQSTEPIDASTPWMAASEGNLALLESSIQSLNLPITCADENGYTLLQAASSYNQIKVMEHLLNLQVDVNATDNEGDTALHYAGNVQSATLLIEVAKIDLMAKNGEGKTALEAHKDNLAEMVDDEDEDEADIATLKQLVEYLSTLRR
mmetsp:Transcript_15478/g.42775  ORF Transcript_15478/g.42775 Transcript_15478/m.42775 type:complete len:158 (-) Transcript_15478:446-919(-)|eukprot:CAMPEP_0198121166 /NCGR_PEP_ID=MMETSP1442-20131203/31356_1 /TAXON_ID= /ORGANISM="Craspedostauros australis, Strain CCMP3328" /LENGTH=157 /DNA_ID=CAMNT_0043779935 /DNA_START=58 /DNA_END=531 /DNA_ORIENTATION=+